MRLIDADALKQADFQDFSNTDVLCAIDEAPTINAVPVVRCVDCKHYNTTGCSVGFGWCERMDIGTNDEFFCACAEDGRSG